MKKRRLTLSDVNSPEKNGVIRKAPKLDVANADVPSDLADKTKKVV